MSETVNNCPWADLVRPIVQKFEVAAAFDREVSWNSEGAQAMGRLIATMAQRLDEARTASPDIAPSKESRA